MLFLSSFCFAFIIPVLAVNVHSILTRLFSKKEAVKLNPNISRIKN